MATLKCNSCGGDIASGARRVQCPCCGELFPFACSRCGKKLRPPFSVFDDERTLTLDSPPQPLCEAHYLRKCPDCNKWFGADENPGYFRCATCAQHHQNSAPAPVAETTFSAPTATPDQGGVATKTRAKSGGSNALVIGLGVCALLALVGWMILGR